MQDNGPFQRAVPRKAQGRRRQADRTAQMQERIITAAIQVLCERGYPAATVKTIAAQAGVSVGALQHQFETKARLMAAVVVHLFNARKAYYRQSLPRTAQPGAAAQLTASAWEVLRQPEFLAMIEIALARRSDPDLDGEIAAPLMRIERVFERWTIRLWRSAGFTAEVAAMGRRMSGAFLTGLAVRYASGVERNPEELLANWMGTLALFEQMPDLIARVAKVAPLRI